MNETFNIYARSHFGPEATTMLLVPVVALLVWSWRFVLSRRREERRVAEDAERRLSEPLAIGERSVAGTVELADGHPFALRITVTEQGSQATSLSGREHHAWTETRRTNEAHPFDLRLASGAVLRVEPGDADVELDAELAEREWIERDKRARRATVTAGDAIVVHGMVRDEQAPAPEGAGYRSAASRFTLVPKHGQLFVSTKGLTPSHLPRAQPFSGVVSLLVALTIASCLSVAPAIIRALLGTDVQAQVVQNVYSAERNAKGLIVERSAIRYSIGGRTFEEEIRPRGYVPAPDRRETNEPSDRRVWVRHVGGMFEDVNTLGRGVTVGEYQLLFAYAFAAIAVGLVRRTRAEQSDEPRSSVERGEGPLPEPSGERFSAATP